VSFLYREFFLFTFFAEKKVKAKPAPGEQDDLGLKIRLKCTTKLSCSICYTHIQINE